MLTGCGEDKKDDSNKATADTAMQSANVAATKNESETTVAQKSTTTDNEKSGDSASAGAAPNHFCF